VGLNFNSSKADWFYFANIITKEALVPANLFVNNGKYQTFADQIIKLNPTITVILMAKFNHTITAYLVPYI